MPTQSYLDLTQTDVMNLESVAPGVTDIVAGQAQPGESWYDTLAKSIPLLAATLQQKQLLDVQVQRAKDGLPPLNVSQYAAGAQVGLSPDTKQYLMYGALALAAVYLLPKLMGSSRRGKR